MKIGYAVALLILAAAASKFGTPHMRMAYVCRAAGDGCGRYFQCTYLGVGGNRIFVPNVAPDEDCPVIKFFPADWPWART